MTPPSKLIFREWKKPEVAFEFFGWAPYKGQVFVKDAHGRRQVIRLVLPGVLAQSAVVFPGAAPTIITETFLLPPPCRTTAEEAGTLRAAAAEARSPHRITKPRPAYNPPNWELAWLAHRNEILLPTAEDQSEFEKCLKTSMSEWRQEYEARKRRLEETRTEAIGREPRDCKPASKPKIELDLGMLEIIYTRPLKESLGRLHGGLLNWTIEVAKHEPTIRDPLLRERWAKENGLKLAEISADKEAFLNWYRAHFPIPMKHPPKDFFDLLSGARAAMADDALCAEVRFVASFADGSRVWLANWERRDPLLTGSEQVFWQSPSDTALSGIPPGRLIPDPQKDYAVETAAANPVATSKDVGTEHLSFKHVFKQLGCKPSTLGDYCKQLGIDPKAITPVDLAHITAFRAKRKQRDHLKDFQGPRLGPKPKRRGSKHS